MFGGRALPNFAVAPASLLRRTFVPGLASCRSNSNLYSERRFIVTTFDSLALSDSILRAIRDKGYETATPIQQQAIPPILDGHDLMGCAQTGTGKTAAFALPALHRLFTTKANGPGNAAQTNTSSDDAPQHENAREKSFDRPARGKLTRGKKGPHRENRGQRYAWRPIRALVLAPTRELAAQIGASFSKYGRFTGLRNTVVYGGVGQGSQVRALEQGVDILVATPGRLIDLMEQGYIDLRQVEILILDEADQMLDMGFIIPLRRIVRSVPRERQTLMFSATMPPEIRKLADEWLKDPVQVQVCPVAAPIELVEQSVYFVEARHKPHLLRHFLQNTDCTRTIVFARTKHGADKIVKHLVSDGIRAAAIHGNKSQNARQRTLEAFKSNRMPVLVATDIAARGLDVSGVSHVINYELPEVPEIYVHRIGRTGRAGATGVATSFCARDERGQLRQIERLTRRTIPVDNNHPEYPGGSGNTSPAEQSGDLRPMPRPKQPRPRRPFGTGRPANGSTEVAKTQGRKEQGRAAVGDSSAGQPSKHRRRRRFSHAKRRAQ